MNKKQKLATILGSAAFATGAFAYFEPGNSTQSNQGNDATSQSASQGSDAQDAVNEQIRRDGDAAGDAELGKKAIPGIYEFPK